MSALLKWRFRWRTKGKDHETVIEASSYAMACYRLGMEHFDELLQAGRESRAPRVPEDFVMDLSKPEPVE